MMALYVFLFIQLNNFYSHQNLQVKRLLREEQFNLMMTTLAVPVQSHLSQS